MIVNIRLTIPDDAASRIALAISEMTGYQRTIPNPDNPDEMIPNPKSRATHSKEMMAKAGIKYIQKKLLEYESHEAIQDVRDEISGMVFLYEQS